MCIVVRGLKDMSPGESANQISQSLLDWTDGPIVSTLAANG
jgi:hypothetical protein